MYLLTFLYVCGLAAAEVDVIYNSLQVTTKECKTSVCNTDSGVIFVSAAQVRECWNSLTAGCGIRANIDFSQFGDISNTAICEDEDDEQNCIYDLKPWTDVLNAVDSDFTITVINNLASTSDRGQESTVGISCGLVKSNTQCDTDDIELMELETAYIEGLSERGVEVSAQLLLSALETHFLTVQAFDRRVCRNTKLIRHTAAFSIAATRTTDGGLGGSDGASSAFAATLGALASLFPFVA